MDTKSSRSGLVRRVLLIVVALGIVALIVFQNRGRQIPKLPVYSTVPDFSLVTEDGRRVSSGDLKGSVFVADFIFTRCAGTCPVMSGQMRELQNAFLDLPDVRLVSITVDPEYDTQEVLQKFAKQYGAKPQKWMFLTGDKATIHHLAQKGFRLGVSEEGGSAAEPIIHSTKFVLVDKQGRIRGYYDGTEEESVKRLIEDMRLLREETT